MNDKVISLKGGPLPGEVNPEIVTRLEMLLEQAKSGSLIGFAYATVRTNDVSASGWDGMACRNSLGMAINFLQHRYVVACMENRDLD